LTTNESIACAANAQKSALIEELPKACFVLASALAIEDRERKIEAIQALILALKSHFPSFYRQWFQSCPAVSRYEPTSVSEKLIKLKRQAVASLAKYL
ncbi:MAG: hypothetical protein HY074_02520, partial [Deltaproteobacteria bacterium]|nr:hypothetical protein [Deltaproteobacteria bacterium]